MQRIEEHGTPTSQFTYLATEHHFANLSVRQAAALALARTCAFFAAHLCE